MEVPIMTFMASILTFQFKNPILLKGSFPYAFLAEVFVGAVL